VKVLLATDLSAANDQAIALVQAAPWPSGSRIRVITAVEPYATFSDLAPEMILQFDDLAEKKMRDGLEALAGTLRRDGLTVESELRLGRAADEIVGEAREMGADLVIVGNRGHGPFEATLLGSVSSNVVDRSPCPVLVARSAATGKVVMGDDGSAGARAAEALLTRLPVFATATVHVVGVVDVPLPWLGAMDASMATTSPEIYTQLAGVLREQATANIEAARARLESRGLLATARLREGHAGAEIVAEAEEWGADVIVLGSRGHTGLARLILGSVAKSVLTHAHCSVLVVHEPAPK